MATIKYVRGDLFTTDCKVLMQCISADFGMGAGIAVEFTRRYKVMQFLKQGAWLNSNNLIKTVWPSCFPVIDEETGTMILNLVTKEKYSDKPTINSLENALIHASYYIGQRGIYEIALPKIGSGLDRLPWKEVEDCLLYCLPKAPNVELTVYHLD